MQKPIARDARVVDENIDGAERILNLGDARLASLEIADVEFEMRHAGFCGKIPRCGLVAVIGGGDLISGLVQSLADRSADAARSAGDNCYT